MKWYFPVQLPGEVDNEVTQRDQFSNDEVDLSQTIVREAIQNSLDAVNEDSPYVKVLFRWVDLSSNSRNLYLKKLLDEQLKHADAANLNLDEVDFDSASALLIEDFGTKGLTGSVSKKTNDHFTDFWRRHGKSHKTGLSRGRWGLGKLVYSTTSQVGAFFGATRREGDPDVHIMGQTVLNLHSVDSKDYKPHAFFGDVDNEDDVTRAITVPLKDTSQISEFMENFFINKRTDESGLSVIIPFPNPAFNRDSMIGVAIANYFYPIITQQLVLEFDKIRIDQNNIRKLAHKYAKEEFEDIDNLFNFIEEFYQMGDEGLHQLGNNWFKDQRLDEDDFEEIILEQLKQDFSDGKLLGFRFPIIIKKKDGTKLNSFFSAYIKKPSGLRRGTDLYVRRGLTLPGESKFRERKALAAVIAEDDAIAEFLGYAENPAHTQWIGSSEKLVKNYQAPQKNVAAIKKSLIQLYDTLACVTEEKDELALLDYFWGTEPENKLKGKKQKITPEPPPPPPKPKPRDFAITKSENGFTVKTTPKANPENFPQIIKIEVAYDVTKGDPFKSFSPLDFKIGKNGSVSLAATPSGKLIDGRENQLRLSVNKLPFKFTASGFDPHRDLKIRLAKEA